MKQKTCPIRSWRNLKFSALHGVVFAALFIQGFEHFAARAEKKYVLVEIDTDDLTQIGGKKYAAPDSSRFIFVPLFCFLSFPLEMSALFLSQNCFAH